MTLVLVPPVSIQTQLSPVDGFSDPESVIRLGLDAVVTEFLQAARAIQTGSGNTTAHLLLMQVYEQTLFQGLNSSLQLYLDESTSLLLST